MGHLLDWYKDPKKFQGEVNLDVISFIDEITDFPDRDGNSGEQIDHLFSAGYCFYFASMLKTAFGGQMCWIQDRGHVAWADVPEGCSFDELQKAGVYDITGLCDDYETLWPVAYLGDTVLDFMHNGKEFHLNQAFADWCKFCHVTETYAIETIWGIVPEDEIRAQYKAGLNLVDTAYQYWMQHCEKLQQIFRYSYDCELPVWPDHDGVNVCLESVEKKALNENA